jgi:hypothetical protein
LNYTKRRSGKQENGLARGTKRNGSLPPASSFWHEKILLLLDMYDLGSAEALALLQIAKNLSLAQSIGDEAFA